MQVITNIKTYGSLVDSAALLIDDSGSARIVESQDIPYEATVIDNDNQFALLPGWLDSHVHGNVGHDFADDNLDSHAIEKIACALSEAGVAFCMPTLVSRKLDDLKKTLTVIDQYIASQQQQGARPGVAQIVGVHLEGPFIAKNCNGAHDVNVLQTKINTDMVCDLINAAPHVKAWKITLAPELEGAIQFIHDIKQIAKERNIAVNVFIGHTNAHQVFLQQAFTMGAVGFTHLGNANCEKVHRSHGPISYSDLKSNVVKFALDDSNNNSSACFELIADNHHLSAEFVNFALAGRENKAILITDALGPTGLADGQYHLGDLDIEKKGEVFYLKGTETLAGSAASYATIVKKFSAMIQKEGEALWNILYHATVKNPRQTALPKTMQLNDSNNFVLIDRTGNLILSVCNGKTKVHKNIFDKTIASTQGYFVTKDKKRGDYADMTYVTGNVTPTCP